MRYISKDYVIRGSLIDLSSAEAAWDAFDKRVRTSVRKGERMGVRIRPFRMEDLPVVTKFTPNDDDIPPVFESRHTAYVAEAEDIGEVLGWILLAGVGTRKLFMLCHASVPEGKRRQTPNLLLWHAVKTWAGGPYRYFDVGASYRETLQKYFSGFRQLDYPMIMRPPDHGEIRVSRQPFTSDAYALEPGDVAEGKRKLAELVGSDPMTFFPNGHHAVRAMLRECADEGRFADGKKLLVVTSFGGVPDRIARAAEDVCVCTTDASEPIGAALAVHEHGVPVSDPDTIRTFAAERNIPVIEDLTEGWGTEGTGRIGSRRVYDFSTVHPIRFGAVVSGVEIPFERMWNVHGCFDGQKTEKVLGYLAAHDRPLADIRSDRARVWNRYAANLVSVSDPTVPCREGMMPYAYPAKVGSDEEAKHIVEWLARFGIEAEAWKGRAAVLLPCHQGLSDRHIDYVSGAFLAMFREKCGLPHA